MSEHTLFESHFGCLRPFLEIFRRVSVCCSKAIEVIFILTSSLLASYEKTLAFSILSKSHLDNHFSTRSQFFQSVLYEMATKIQL